MAEVDVTILSGFVLQPYSGEGGVRVINKVAASPPSDEGFITQAGDILTTQASDVLIPNP